MSRLKGWFLVSSLVIVSVLFLGFTKCSVKGTDPSEKQRLLTTIGTVLEEQHYSPKKIDDVFSKMVFKKYLEELDIDKNLFLQSDINDFKQYETYLDDELHGAEIKFVPTVNVTYNKRIPEVVAIYRSILAHPFSFTVDETIKTENDKETYPATEAERTERWRKKLKLLTLERYSDMLDVKEKNPKDTSYNKPDSVLEKDARNRVLKAMDRVYDRIKAKYDDNERFNAYVNTITNLMDPHTDYFPPVEKRAFDEQMSGRFYGIGAQLQEQDGIIKIASLLSGGPAFKSGEFLVNDVIVKVAQGKDEPVDITGYDISDAVKLIRGNKGTEVRLTIKRQDGSVKVVTLIRDEIVQDESFARSAVVTENGKKIGYIYLPDFYADFDRPEGARCSDDVAKEIKKLQAENVSGIVIDLRFNGGGSLYEVVQMVGLFIKDGPVVQVRDKEGKSSMLNDKNSAVQYDGPLAVMVNEGSASASEIFAAAIQDYKRGIIVGSTSTYGKGTVQKNMPLGKRFDFFSDHSEFGAIKLTFQKFYRINGGSTQLKGVTPDIILPDAYDYLKIREKDNPAALPWDEIAKASFDKWESNVDIDKVVAKENSVIQANQAFKFIQSNTAWLAKRNELPINLNIEKYKAEQKLVRLTVTQNQTLTKLTKEMNIKSMEADKDKFENNPDKSKGDRYIAWLKSLKTDIYIKQTVDVINDMITSSNSNSDNK